MLKCHQWGLYEIFKNLEIFNFFASMEQRVLPRELNVNTCSCWIRFHCLRIYKVTFSITSNLSHPQDFLRWDFTQISDQNSTDKSGDRCKIFVCPCGHCLSVSLTERWWMTLARTLHVFLQHYSPHKMRSTPVALGRIAWRLYLSQRDVGWLCPSTGALNIT